MVELTESELVRNCIAGERKYQEMLYSKFCRKMMGICFRYSGNRAAAEDLLQEGFIRVFMHLDQFRMQGSLEGWIKRIIINTALEQIRKKDILKNTIELEKYVEEEELLISDMDGFHDLVKLIQELPAGYRTVFNLHALDGFTHKEIAAELGITEGTSKSQYHAARNALKLKLKILNVHG